MLRSVCMYAHVSCSFTKTCWHLIKTISSSACGHFFLLFEISYPCKCS